MLDFVTKNVVQVIEYVVLYLFVETGKLSCHDGESAFRSIGSEWAVFPTAEDRLRPLTTP